MNSLFYIAVIVAIVMTAVTVQKMHKAKLEQDSRNERDDEEMARLDALEERIRVLERIVTEDKRDLRDEIDRL